MSDYPAIPRDRRVGLAVAVGLVETVGPVAAVGAVDPMDFGEVVGAAVRVGVAALLVARPR